MGVTVEGAEGQMAGLARHLEREAVRKSESRLSPIEGEGSGNRVRILDGQVFVVEEHLNSGGDLGRSEIVHRAERPGRFHQHEARDPRPRSDEVLSPMHAP